MDTPKYVCVFCGAFLANARSSCCGEVCAAGLMCATCDGLGCIDGQETDCHDCDGDGYTYIEGITA